MKADWTMARRVGRATETVRHKGWNEETKRQREERGRRRTPARKLSFACDCYMSTGGFDAEQVD